MVGSVKKSVDLQQFAHLVPLDSVNPENLRKLAQSASVEALPNKTRLFADGDVDNKAIYLLDGEVSLGSGKTAITRSVRGGTPEALYALANLKPRQYSGVASGPVTILRVDGGLLDKMLTWEQVSGMEQVAGIEVTEFPGDSSDRDWMTRILQTRAFLNLPSANISSLFARLEQVPVRTGQIIIRQGDRGDYFYIIKSGRYRVVHKPADNAPSVALADLAPGDCFGEEALLSSAPRNATVAALGEGSLMRLAKADFDVLLRQPLLTMVEPREGVEMVKAGAGLIDVRLESEFRNGNIRGSINIPLYALRQKCDTLDRGRKYVVYCDTGSRSAAAAYLLQQRGFDISILQGGLSQLVHPPGTA